MQIDDLLRIAMERRASDLHLKVGNYPHLRIDGELAPLTDQPRVTAEDMPMSNIGRAIGCVLPLSVTREASSIGRVISGLRTCCPVA